MREEIMNRITDAIKREIGEEYRVSLRKVKKNNGLILQSVEILEPGMSICPCIYIDDLLDKVTSGEIGVSEAAQEVIEIYKENKDSKKICNAFSKIDKQIILEKVVYQLINEGKNRERLCNMPHRKFLDLAVIYRVIVVEDQDEMVSFNVTNAICKKYGLSAAELEHAAKQNTEKKGFKVQTLESWIAELAGLPEEASELKDLIWILSNTQMNNGATVMLYDKYFDRLAESIGSDLYVLPSSIHEVIAVPVDVKNLDEIKAIVGIINFSEVMEDEMLSGNVYQYSRKDGNISIV